MGILPTAYTFRVRFTKYSLIIFKTEVRKTPLGNRLKFAKAAKKRDK